jgi:hypothetical protein
VPLSELYHYKFIAEDGRQMYLELIYADFSSNKFWMVFSIFASVIDKLKFFVTTNVQKIVLLGSKV